MFNFPWLPAWTAQDDEDDDELGGLLQGMFDEVTVEKEITIPAMHWRDAYEANKTRDTCILCGARTVIRPLFSSSIKACKCVDELAKKDTTP